MKRHFLCRVTSFALAAILAAESSMTAAAAQTGVVQETTVDENTEITEESGTDAENLKDVADESGTDAEGEAETVVESATETESESESNVENETEIQTEIETETQEENVTETEEISLDGAEESLAAPVIENVTVSEEGKVSFEWTLVENATGYRVYRTDDANPADDENATWQQMESGLTIGDTKVTFEDSSATLGKAYYYKVYAYRMVAGETEEEQIEDGIFSELVNSKVELQGIAWSENAFAAFTLEKGETKQLSIVYNPVNATRSDIVWSSDNTSVAAVDENGLVTAVGKGTATITAKADTKTVTATVTVTAIPVTKIVLEKDSLEIVKGGEKEVAVTILPENATSKEFTAEPENNELVSCIVEEGKIILKAGEQFGKTTVKVKADGLSTTLTVSIVEEETQRDDVSTVIPVRKLSINLPEEEGDSKRTIELDTDKTYTLTAKVSPENATNAEITWSSSDEKVAVVENGVITAVGKGMAQITAQTANGVSDTVTVIVSNTVAEVKIDGSPRTLYCNGNKEIFEGKLPNTYNILMYDSGLDYVYRSTDETIATVDENGQVTAIAPGTVQIIALHPKSGKSDALTITVKRLIEEIKLPIEKTTVVLGTEMRLSAEIAPEKVSSESIKWTVKEDSPSACLVYDEAKKVFRADCVGTAKIVASSNDAGNGKVYAEIQVTIEDTSAANKVSLTYNEKTSATVKSGKQINLVTRVKDKSGNDKSLNATKVTYKSSNEKVATVDEKGTVTAIAGGTAKITASVMDGSNVAGSFTFTVEQRPEEIVFAREEFLVAPKGSVTLTPTVLPAKTKNKTVTWKIPVDEIVLPDGYEVDNTGKKNLVKVDTKGKVTVSKDAPEGLTAAVYCTSKAFSEGETPVFGKVIIRVGKTKVTSLKMNKTSIELTGLGTQAQLEFTAKGADESTTYTWTSSDEEVVAVDKNGLVTVNGYGTAKITLCADNAKAVSCTVAAYPVKKAHGIAAASGNYGIQQAENDGNSFIQLYFINKNTKAKLEPELFTFTSSKPELVYVDEAGRAYANPQAQITKDTTVTITATLKDDPLKRKVTTKVTVWKEQQVKNITFQYSESGKTYADITDCVEDKFKKGNTFKIKAIAYNADNEPMSGEELSFKVSDTSLADIVQDEKSNVITVTIKKAGKFKITCMANDKMHVSRQITVGMYLGNPILKMESIGTINKNGEIEEVKGMEGVLSDTEFEVTGVYGSTVDSVAVDKTSVRMKLENGTYTDTGLGFSGDDLEIKECGNGKYQLAMDKKVLAKNAVKTGTYEVVLRMKRSNMDTEVTFNQGDNDEDVTTTFKIGDTRPSVKISNVTVNSFERGTWTKLKVSTKAEVEKVSLATDDILDDYYEVMERQDGWYIAIEDKQFENCASKKIQGRIYVKLEGYENAIPVSVTVTAKSTKPSLKQLSVPDILVSQGDTAAITLYNNTAKENLTDYQVSLKSEKNAKWNISDKNASDKFEIKLEESGSNITKNASYKQKVVVEKDGWRTPIELDITVKASAEKTNPSVTFDKKSITLNTSAVAKGETATFAVKTNKSNVQLKTGEWEFVNTAYKDMFTAEYADGSLTIGLKEDAVNSGMFTKSSYKLQFVNVFEGTTGYEQVKTASITVSINKKNPTVNVKISGKMDLLNRKASTLTATVSVSGVSAEIANISLVNGTDSEFTSNFYSVREKNKITIYARNAAELVAGTAYKGKVKVTLENGTELEKDISFKLTQSVPKLKSIAKQTVYKAEADRVLDFDLNETLPEGVQIETVVTRALPTGFGVEYDKGHALVVLNDDAIKPGQYTIQADVYFKGAQKTTDSEDGKPVRVKITVQVKEQ